VSWVVPDAGRGQHDPDQIQSHDESEEFTDEATSNIFFDIAKGNTDRYVLNHSWNRTHRLARLNVNFGFPGAGFGFGFSDGETAAAFSEISAT
jgi:hypothetical protein